MSCTTVLVGKGASYDGSTMIARTDDGDFEVMKTIVVEPDKQPRKYKSKISHVEIDLPDDPMRYTASPHVDPEVGVWAEAGINAAGVGMSATETLTSNPMVLAGGVHPGVGEALRGNAPERVVGRVEGQVGRAGVEEHMVVARFGPLVADVVGQREGHLIRQGQRDRAAGLAEAADGADGIKKAREYSPDVILMDIGLPNIDGIEATQKIKDFNPNIKVLIFTSRDGENDVFEAFKAGADGYIMKGATPEQTVTAIKSVYEGVGWIDPAIAKLVFANLQKPSTQIVSEPESVKQGRNNSYGLTERELDVLELMVEGLTNPQIADRLVIARSTAKAHVHSILQKLCTTSRTQATVMAINERLV